MVSLAMELLVCLEREGNEHCTGREEQTVMTTERSRTT